VEGLANLVSVGYETLMKWHVHTWQSLCTRVWKNYIAKIFIALYISYYTCGQQKDLANSQTNVVVFGMIETWQLAVDYSSSLYWDKY
jgi:hypothetical protein